MTDVVRRSLAPKEIFLVFCLFSSKQKLNYVYVKPRKLEQKGQKAFKSFGIFLSQKVLRTNVNPINDSSLDVTTTKPSSK